MSKSSDHTRGESCTFCEKVRGDVDSLIAGPPGVYICNDCIEICNSILNEEDKRIREAVPAGSNFDVESFLSPREITERLNEYVYGQEDAKRVLAVAVHNH